MATRANKNARRPGAPIEDWVPIDYSATDQTLDEEGRRLFITTAGTLVVETARGKTRTIAFTTGYHDICIRKIVKEGSSTAAGFVLI